MDALPNRDTVAAFEARLGKPLTSVLIWLIAIAIACGAAGGIIASLTAAYRFFYPMLPASGWMAVAQRVAAAFAIALLYAISRSGVAALAKLRNIERVDTNAQAIAAVVAAEMQRTTDVLEQLKSVGERLAYIENKVGGELYDVMLQRLTQADEIKGSHAAVNVALDSAPHKLSDQDRERLSAARRLLRQAAQVAKSAENGGGALDMVANQAWLYSQMTFLLSSFFSFSIYAAFGNQEEIRRRLMAQTGQSEDGRARLVALGEYFEKLAENLTLDDIQPEGKLPESFADFNRA
jgi:hypothetical protein